MLATALLSLSAPVPQPELVAVAGPNGYTQALVKCFYTAPAYRDVGYPEMPWNQFYFARHEKCGITGGYNYMALKGDFRAGASGMFDVSGWMCNDEYWTEDNSYMSKNRKIDEELGPKSLAQACEWTLRKYAKDQSLQLMAPRLACPNTTTDAAVKGHQGDFYECGRLTSTSYINAGGPQINVVEASAPSFPSWVTYGDSLSDMGSNMFWLGTIGNAPWYPLPSSPYYHGRWGNGLNWQEFLALGIKRSQGVLPARVEWNAETRVQAMAGFASLATGGATANINLLGGRMRESTFFGSIASSAQQFLSQDIWYQLISSDKFGVRAKDAASVNVLKTCSAAGADECGEHASCEGYRCTATDGPTGVDRKVLPDKCEWYYCLCKPGTHVDAITGECAAPAEENTPELPIAVVWVGANDVFMPSGLSDKFDNFFTETGDLAYPKVLSNALADTERFWETLYERGHRQILAVNLPDLGIIPSNKDAAYTKKEDVARMAKANSMVSNYFNAQLDERVERWRKAHPDAILALYDFHGSINHILQGEIEHPGASGKMEPFDVEERYKISMSSCSTITDSGETRGCDASQPGQMIFDNCVNGFGRGLFKGFEQCDAATEQTNLFWDFAHPSTKGYCWVSYWMHLQMHKDFGVVAPDLSFYEGMCGDVPAWAGAAEKAADWEVCPSKVDSTCQSGKCGRYSEQSEYHCCGNGGAVASGWPGDWCAKLPRGHECKHNNQCGDGTGTCSDGKCL